MIKKFGDKFFTRIFTEYEVEYAIKYKINNIKVSYFAKRFAAKEAYTKALGGLNNGIRFKEIGIKNDNKGKPNLYLRNKQITNAEVSLSDDGDYAIAMVIVK
ncbi:MAG: holo-ACP synthase [Rickettsiaceae bacterium H1]|nr:holo-ACP synthase [Rickettsiaceae bacterium H1]